MESQSAARTVAAARDDLNWTGSFLPASYEGTVMNVVRHFPAVRQQERHSRLQTIFQSAAIGIGICHLNGQISEANPELSRMLGYTPEEMANTHMLDFGPSSREHKYEIEDDQHAVGELAGIDFLRDEPLLRELLRGERDSFATEKRYLRKDGSELWGHLTVSLGRDRHHQPAFLIAMLADATERKRVEEHLREAEKMEVIGRLAGGIAHDFNNLLTGILLYCDLLSAGLEGSVTTSRILNPRTMKGGLPNGDLATIALCQHVDEVRMAGEQGAALTHQLLSIARKQSAEPRVIVINEIVASTKNLLRRLIGEQIALVANLDLEAGRVLADPSQLKQVLLNLVLNARDAMPQGGTITLSTRVAEFPGELAHDGNPGTGRRAVALAVSDNGQGMNAETRRRLFEPFYTTKEPGCGTGLGLATVQRVVNEAGGTIRVQSEAGRGTCIEIFFPMLSASIEKFAVAESVTDESSSRTNVSNLQPASGNDRLAGETPISKAIRETTRKPVL